MKLKITMAISAVLALCASSQAATFHTESFESAPGAGYTINTAFDAATFDFFDRYAVPDNSNGARDDFQNGWDGDYGLLGQNFAASGGPGNPITVDIPGINIAGKSDLGVRIRFAANQSEPDFTNYEAADGDGIDIYANIDGGGQVLIGAFKPNSTGDSDLYRDINLDGVGNGPVLFEDLVSYGFLIPGTGNSLDLSISLTSTGGFEMLVLDDVRVEDNTAIPEPTSMLLLVVGLAGIACRRRG